MHPIHLLLLSLTTLALAGTLPPLAGTFSPPQVPTTTLPLPPTAAAIGPVPKTSVPYNPYLLHSHLECSIFNTAHGADIDFLLAEILFKSPKKKTCYTPARTCRRHFCRATSAIYVCNDNDHGLDLLCLDDVGLWAFRVAAECCPGASGSKSGQVFNDQRGYNVIAAYGNCNHGMDADHPSMGPADDPWGPNGEPECM